MASMTTSTARREADRHCRKRRGFSLVEVLLAMSISSLALAAVLSTVTFIARSSVSTTDYAEMDREARTALEIFARDVRMASGAPDFVEDVSVNLVVLNSSGTTSVNYTYVSGTATFYREYGESGQQALIKNIEPGSFHLTRYSIADVDGVQQKAENPLETKQIQLQLRSVRTGPAKAFASNNVVSARYVMRNKTD
jgi:prepilin-type N-terminal cleavage/methylation domain-containing protein